MRCTSVWRDSWSCSGTGSTSTPGVGAQRGIVTERLLHSSDAKGCKLLGAAHVYPHTCMIESAKWDRQHIHSRGGCPERDPLLGSTTCMFQSTDNMSWVWRETSDLEPKGLRSGHLQQTHIACRISTTADQCAFRGVDHQMRRSCLCDQLFICMHSGDYRAAVPICIYAICIHARHIYIYIRLASYNSMVITRPGSSLVGPEDDIPNKLKSA